MVALKVKDKEYNLKFGFKSLRRTKILKEVVDIRKKLYEGDGGENAEEKGIEQLEEVLDLTCKLVLSGLQKYHKEFCADYKDEKSIEEQTEKVEELIEDYMDEEESMPIIDLFNVLVDELFNNGFLFKKTEKPENVMENQDATVIPEDHKKKEN